MDACIKAPLLEDDVLGLNEGAGEAEGLIWVAKDAWAGLFGCEAGADDCAGALDWAGSGLGAAGLARAGLVTPIWGAAGAIGAAGAAALGVLPGTAGKPSVEVSWPPDKAEDSGLTAIILADSGDSVCITGPCTNSRIGEPTWFPGKLVKGLVACSSRIVLSKVPITLPPDGYIGILSFL